MTAKLFLNNTSYIFLFNSAIHFPCGITIRIEKDKQVDKFHELM